MGMPSKGDRVRWSVRVPHELAGSLLAMAERLKVPVNDLVVAALGRAVDEFSGEATESTMRSDGSVLTRPVSLDPVRGVVPVRVRRAKVACSDHRPIDTPYLRKPCPNCGEK